MHISDEDSFILMLIPLSLALHITPVEVYGVSGRAESADDIRYQSSVEASKRLPHQSPYVP